MTDRTKKGYEQAKEARLKAYAPYSKFLVGAALYTENGSFFQGANIENASYGGCMCAERTAVYNAILHGHKDDITELYICTDPVAVPCGMCLQVLTEFCSQDLEIILCDLDGVKDRKTLRDFLPNPFDPASLNKSGD